MLRLDVPLCLSKKGLVLLGVTHFLGQMLQQGNTAKRGEAERRCLLSCLVREARARQGPRDHTA